ncbi:unnamed protein product [Thelazia callipaeda]|uniref:Elongation factor Ts, mitochondrial n=1 Tax=Thelazia callipaeda TaxID=103827 RepID=A0A0N5CZ62_THECL|nr:unnamed protein product [Thelazia callipaeda]
MFTSRQLIRSIALKELRKKTGYSYVNCRKAINEFGLNNLNEAVKWLKEMAAKEGWEKAAKLSGRPTKQGVVSVLVENNKAAIVEVNCETDFVSRNENFKQLVSLKCIYCSAASDRAFSYMDSLRTSENCKSIKELIIEAISKLGENISISKAQVLIAQPNVQLFSYAHPREGTEAVFMGKYVSVVGLKRTPNITFPTETLGEQLCQHIIGMRQAFMLNPSQTVHEYVTNHGASIVDFYRFEMNENDNGEVTDS